jgi:hypothetical protein
MVLMRTVKALVLIVALAVCAACGLSPFDEPQAQISAGPNGAFNAMYLNRASASALLVKRVTQVSPILFPAYFTEGTNACTAFGKPDSFTVQCYGGALNIALSTQTENPQSYKPKLVRSQKFRADPAAAFMDVDPGNASAVRMLLWVEPGTSSDKACHCVHYDLHTYCILQDEFFKVAGSLQAAK